MIRAIRNAVTARRSERARQVELLEQILDLLVASNRQARRHRGEVR